MLSSFTAMMFFLFSENEVHKKYGYAAMLILVIGLVIVRQIDKRKSTNESE
ncbi:Uncharacterised protein [Sphingobacterium mizutaii]|uniref:Uncharacterized protein n=2 Tax=Sphingobacterium mizutaii TaxID=1010 RepID=A0AAJ4XAQ5_9SPHI|nr:hypothetical protein SAMN05192578_101377 [Sphingobacterium mizutaii]SNV48144.1 Uncharacterised protein [Sphingobacterium mizutaii]